MKSVDTGARWIVVFNPDEGKERRREDGVAWGNGGKSSEREGGWMRSWEGCSGGMVSSVPRARPIVCHRLVGKPHRNKTSLPERSEQALCLFRELPHASVISPPPNITDPLHPNSHHNPRIAANPSQTSVPSGPALSMLEN